MIVRTLVGARDDGGVVELTAHTVWESLAAIRAFAGDDITTAVVEPEARTQRGGGCEPASSGSTSTAYEVMAVISSPLNS
ncbi:hypothetical protein Mycsm_04098 [Mycobacterium sp. JS623]|nr:hypothetical protein Mycsm_04098 [Mycobacterium sp. JS623]